MEFDLNPTRGRERREVRPCLVVSTDALNRSRFGAVIICPITTRKQPASRWRTTLTPKDLRVAAPGWKPRPHWVATDQLVTVDTRQRALRHLASVIDDEKMLDVDDSLRMLLEL